MAYEHKNNSGNLFPNEKRPGKQDPDFSNTILIHGIMTKVKMWDNGDQGPKKPRFGLKFEEADNSQQSRKPTAIDDDPF